MILDSREKAIVRILLDHEWITISQIAKTMYLSNKTVSQSLKKIDDYFEGSDVSLIRKPKVGISLVGKTAKINQLIQAGKQSTVPSTKDERVQYLCFEILKKSGYFTRQDLQEALFVGKTTLEKDMNKVNEIFSLFHVTIEWIPGKGSFLNLMEQEKRKLAIDLIYYFWGHNWQVIRIDHSYVHTIEGIPEFARAFVNLDMLKEIDQLLQSYLSRTKQKLSDMSYHSLLLHLLIAIERVKEGQLLEEMEPNDEGAANRELLEFMQELEEHFEIRLPISEMMFLQIHLNIDLQKEKEPLWSNASDDVIREIIHQTIDEYDEISLVGLIAHIKSVVERIRNGLPVVNPFVMDVKQSFPVSFEEAIQLKQALEDMFVISIPEDEVAYLAVHLQAFKERKKEENAHKLKALLVCGSGKGTSQLLAARIRRKFPSIKVSRILSIQELAKTEVQEDVILSTINLEMQNHKILYVSPVLSIADQGKIEKFLEESKQHLTRTREFAQLIQPDLIFLDKEFADVETAIQFMGDKLTSLNYTRAGIVQSAIDREKLSFTSFGKFATPHGSSEFVNRSTIAFLRLAEEIRWGQTKVKYLFFICIKNETPSELEKIYDNLLEIIDIGDQSPIAKGKQTDLLRYLKEGT
ncbi:PTS sugar transporter [Enterococcus florum]|uniref:PTS sugar transporter n=1 Tax=Enterococcus florum TaxID=2480627 RepID=A0A4P5P9M4_9ENTE|nr:BglG family transcription antiterminator [Enterococcus florum]GCF94620.1 PTS sugar transporter [Enterococcus florum]